jgi:hypothetical protein
VNERGARRTAHGNTLAFEDLVTEADAPQVPGGPGPIRVTDAGGQLLAIGEPAPGGLLQPVVVLV